MQIKTITVNNTAYDIGVDYENISDVPVLATVATSGSYNDLSDKPTIPSATSDLVNDSGFINKNVNDLTNYTPSSQTTSQLELVLNSETYKLKGILKDSTGSTIYTSNEIDLPLESVVVSGTYDSQTKEVVLTLVNGNTIRFSVADLVSGLVSSTDLATVLASYYTKTETDTLLGGKQPSITSTNKLSADLVDDTNATNKFVSASDKTNWSAKYDLPSGGIPSTDLSSAVQTSLGKADTAIQDISGKQDTIQYSTMPTADSTTVGKIVQYTGTTTQDYTNGYFYIGTTDGESVPTYSWENIEVQAGGGGENINTGYVIILDYTDKTQVLKMLQELYDYYLETNIFKTFMFYSRTPNASIFLVSGINSATSNSIELACFGLKFDSRGFYERGKFTITIVNGVVTNFTHSLNYTDSSNIATLGNAQTITGVKTFNALPTSTINPSNANQFTRKGYVDNAISSAVGSINTVLATLTTPSSNGGE